jgi:ribosome maturation factor RimP
MIKKELIEKLASSDLSEEYFIVSITIKKGNIIEVLIDGDNGVTIQKCIDVSRSIENNLDREEEDFELSVSSAGISKPFKVYRQYTKNIGKKVEINTIDNKPISGILKSVDEKGFDLEVITLERLEKKKKKVEVVKTHRFEFEAKPEVKNIISFK